MKSTLKTSTYLILLVFLLTPVHSESWTEQYNRLKSKYIQLIQKCEQIQSPKKIRKCQKKFLRSFNRGYIKTTRYHEWKGSIIKLLKPDAWKYVLTEIAKNSKLRSMKLIALYQLDESEKFWKLFRDSSLPSRQRESVFQYIDKEEYLVHIIENDFKDYYRYSAVKKIKNQAILKKYARNDKSEMVRISAVINLEDQGTLQYLVLNAPDWSARRIAAKKIFNPDILSQVIKKEKDERVLMQAALNLNLRSGAVILKDLLKHPLIHLQRIAKLKFLLDEIQIKELHGKLDVGYKVKYETKSYGFLRRPGKREIISIQVLNSEDKVILEKELKGRSFKTKEYFGRKGLMLRATIDYDEIRRELVRNPG